MTPTDSDWLDEILRTVRDAGTQDDNFGGEDWSFSDKRIEEAKAAIQAHIDQVMNETRLQELLLAINFWSKTMGDITLKVKVVNGYLGDRVEQLNKEPKS